jgi:hypothetical protein
MTKLGRSTTSRGLCFGVLVLAATAWAQTRPPIVDQIAKTYGVDAFGHIEAIRYTFNAQFPGVNVSCAPQLLDLYAICGSAHRQCTQGWVQNSARRETSEQG